MADARRIMICFGTRPEAIKMAVLCRKLVAAAEFDTRICVTGQHREMLDQVLTLFDIRPDINLNVMQPNQTLAGLTARLVDGLDAAFSEWKPERVLVHGDTTTAFCSALAAYYHRTPVGHVEAGLRTDNIYSPWPEELNRRLVDDIADMLFAPTERARANLEAEGHRSGIYVTGNTVIDALIEIARMIDDRDDIREELDARFDWLDRDRRMVLVTGHRRENFGAGFEQICEALRRIAEDSEVEVVYPVHLNPNVREPVHRILGGYSNIHLIEPVDYLAFVYLMKRSWIILTDSGGIQEEAPALGKPVLVMRDTTERPEAIEAGTARLVGASADQIVDQVERLRDRPDEYERMARATNPFGDGTASDKIIDILRTELQ